MKYMNICLALLTMCSFSVAFSQAAGEIEMRYTEYSTPGVQYRIVYVWNTKTGKSARYYYDNDVWNKSAVALPENPLGEKSTEVGEIMMDYLEYEDPSSGTQYRVVFVWNTKTGKSARYYYDNKVWNKSTVSLPDNPLGEKSTQAGEIQMDYQEYLTTDGTQLRMVYVWNTKTGKSARYYYDNGTWNKSTASLPAAPLN